jgi:hypothetical protein
VWEKQVNESVNQSMSYNIDNNIYKAKIAELKKCYKQASLLTDQIFYIPDMQGDIWEIARFHRGEERTLTIDQFRTFVKTAPPEKSSLS